MVKCLSAAVTGALTLTAAQPAAADEGGVSFWLPGQFGSFFAAPGDPGWSLPLIYYHSSTDASGSKLFWRGGVLTAGLDVRAHLAIAAPTYVFRSPVAGGQAPVGITGLFGRFKVDTSATLASPSVGMLSRGRSDALESVGDLYPPLALLCRP